MLIFESHSQLIIQTKTTFFIPKKEPEFESAQIYKLRPANISSSFQGERRKQQLYFETIDCM